MISTDEDVNMEDQILMLYSSQSLAYYPWCIRVAAQLRTVVVGVSLHVVARCGARRPAIATMHVRGRKAEYTQQRYMNRLIRLKFSTM